MTSPARLARQAKVAPGASGYNLAFATYDALRMADLVLEAMALIKATRDNLLALHEPRRKLRAEIEEIASELTAFMRGGTAELQEHRQRGLQLKT